VASEPRASTLQIAVEALGLRALLPVMLRALPLDRTLSVLTPHATATKHDDDVLSTIERVTDTFTRELPLLQTACLKRALMRYVLLRRHGYAASFEIGVRPGGTDGFEAHAWVTLAGRPIMEREVVDYRRTFVWPRSS
jgi:hypothetical protein